MTVDRLATILRTASLFAFAAMLAAFADTALEGVCLFAFWMLADGTGWFKRASYKP
jgi:hypothetical protein